MSGKDGIHLEDAHQGFPRCEEGFVEGALSNDLEATLVDVIEGTGIGSGDLHQGQLLSH